MCIPTFAKFMYSYRPYTNLWVGLWKFFKYFALTWISWLTIGGWRNMALYIFNLNIWSPCVLSCCAIYFSDLFLHPPNFEWASATISMHLWNYHAALNSCFAKMGKFVGAWRWEAWRCYNKIKHLCCCLKGDLSSVQWQTKESSMMKLWSE